MISSVQPLIWLELTRSAVARYVHSTFAEECYVELVKALAECADRVEAVPRDVVVAFGRAPGKWQDEHEKPVAAPMAVWAKATYNGEWFDYGPALLPDHYDPAWVRTLQ